VGGISCAGAVGLVRAADGTVGLFGFAVNDYTCLELNEGNKYMLMHVFLVNI
jgi:hypothetical protein